MRPALAALLLSAAPALAEVPEVLTDTPVVHSLVAQVMGDLGQPGLLLDRGGDPHAFQLRPSQARALNDADLLFWVGPELSPWLDRAVAGTGLAGQSVALLDVPGVSLLSYGDDHAGHDDHADHDEHAGHDHADHDEHAGHDHADHDEHAGHDHADHDEHAGHDHADHDEHDHGHDDHAQDTGGAHDHAHDGTDPHAWLDPANARAWLTAIAAHLSEADPANAATYGANAAAAAAAIASAEAEVRGILAPVGDAPFYVFHDAYAYFARSFGLTVAGTITLGDAASPGAARLSEIRNRLQADGAACVFAEANHDAGYVRAVIEGTAIRSAVLDPAGATLEPGPGHYAATLRGLAQGIADCIVPRG
jgi:zinc transport system substrate-binding protein